MLLGFVASAMVIDECMWTFKENQNPLIYNVTPASCPLRASKRQIMPEATNPLKFLLHFKTGTNNGLPVFAFLFHSMERQLLEHGAKPFCGGKTMSMSISASYYQNYRAYQAAAKKESAVSAEFSITASIEVAEAEPAPKQTLAEFKKEFAAFVDSLPVHPSQAGAWKSISIHDNVFEKMMNDPEYKTEVEDMVRGQLAQDFVFPPAYSTMRLDADGEYLGTAGGSFHMDKFGKESADAFWKKEPARKTAGNDDDSFWSRKAKDKAAKKKADERKLLEQLIGERRLEREYLQDAFADKAGHGGYSAATAASSSRAFTPVLDSVI